jgi:hypothetical protein
MLGNDPFNFHTIERITEAFGYIFKDIVVTRHDPSTNAVKHIKVPISQSAKEKWAVRTEDDPNAGDETRQKHVQIVLPRIGCELKDLSYDARRKLSTINYRVSPSGNGPTALVQPNPIPYNYNFSLYLQTRTLSDAYMIVAQILAFFRPDYTVPIIDIPEMNLHRDIIVTLLGNSHSDSYEGPMTDKRVIEWNFEFTAQGHIYPPIKEKNVITKADVLLDSGDNVDVAANPRTGNIDQPYDIVITDTVV